MITSIAISTFFASLTLGLAAGRTSKSFLTGLLVGVGTANFLGVIMMLAR